MALKKSSKISISLTDFIDFVCKSGGTKLTKVKQIKNRDDYSPATDFYKTLREGIIKIHKNDDSKNKLDELVNNLTDGKKVKNYPLAISGYKKFWGRKKLLWFDPPHKHWKSGDIDIRINPELGLEINGEFLVIKLYLKAEKLTKDRMQQILALLENNLRKEVEPEITFCVLDVKNSKLYKNLNRDNSYMPLLEGELKSFETIWKSI